MRNRFNTNRFLIESTAFLFAVLFVILVLFISGKIFNENKIQKEVLSGANASRNEGVIDNYAAGLVPELALISSLSRHDQITLFGSSEFSDNPNASYFFLPEEFGIATVGFGHAFHQNFAIFCELLAAYEHLPNSKVVFFISPGWFETKGTNAEAFLEFVPNHFLEQIWTDERISLKYKFEIGRFLSENEENFSGINLRMKSFIDLYQGENGNKITYRLKNKLEASIPSLKRGTKYHYIVQPSPMSPKNGDFNFPKKFEEARESFLLKCSTNDIFVDSAFYRNHIPVENGKVKMGRVLVPEINENREYLDFLLLLDLVKKRNIDCRFVIQSLNPYYYENLADYNPIINSIEEKLKACHIPYLNMFVDNRNDYQPGTLTDIMHLGDLGWLKVNEFLLKTYSK